jgi:hypothetical protein
MNKKINTKYRERNVKKNLFDMQKKMGESDHKTEPL